MSTWRDAAIARSEAITDAWEVGKAYAGRIAEWVLFGCMVANIVEMLPGVNMPGIISSTILGVQSVTLDVAGFGLASLADHARDQGNVQAARGAKATGYMLISLMILTLLLVSIGLLFPPLKQYTDMAEKGLILVRVVMVVVYGHVVHGLRAHGHTQQRTTQQQTDELTALSERITELAETVTMLDSRPQPATLDVDALLAKLETRNQQTIESAIFTMDETLNRVIAGLPGGQESGQQAGEEDTGSGHPGGHQNGEVDTEVDMSSPSGQSVDTQVDMDGKARTQAYRAAHPEAKYKEIAVALGISQKTVQRHLSTQVDTSSGQQATDENTESGHQPGEEDTESGQQASEMDEPIDIRRRKMRVVR